jgi:hypothetical protein
MKPITLAIIAAVALATAAHAQFEAESSEYRFKTSFPWEFVEKKKSRGVNYQSDSPDGNSTILVIVSKVATSRDAMRETIEHTCKSMTSKEGTRADVEPNFMTFEEEPNSIWVGFTMWYKGHRIFSYGRCSVKTASRITS